jgi:predicted small lipoprotein YifL
MTRVLLLLAAVACLSGCGNRRDLVLPDSPPPLETPEQAPGTARN